jgi:hypothetical protein
MKVFYKIVRSFSHIMKNKLPNKSRPKSQLDVDQTVLGFLGNLKIAAPEDLVVLKNKISSYLESRPYNDETKEHADSVQWKRTASEIIRDGYVYDGKACSDLVVVFLTLCKAAGVDGFLVKLKSLDGKITHSIAEVKLDGNWYAIDPSAKISVPVEGALTEESIWNKKYKVWKKGRDVWDLGLDKKQDEDKVCKKS